MQQNNNIGKAHELHFSIAEFGKLMALKNNHSDALLHYREAIRMAVSSKAPEVFFRHYTQCVLESLELNGANDEVIEFCTNADQHYTKLGVTRAIHKKDHGSVLERLGINLLRKGHSEDAQKHLQHAVEISGSGVLPLAEELINWLKRGYTIESTRLLALQRKHKYFVVRRDQVDATKARSLSSVTDTQNSGSAVASTFSL